MISESFDYIAIGWTVLALLIFPVQFFVTAPYGRHFTAKAGRVISNRLGWILMELVSLLVFSFFFLSGNGEKNLPQWIFFSFWVAHYLNRSLIFPFRTRTSGKKIPLLIVLSAVFFNSVNGTLNGYYLGNIDPGYSSSWLTSWQFILGTILFLGGAFINIRADNYLLNLRKPGETGYKIPKGGLFEYISCPNHFGEILEWTGLAIACWNLPALSFAVWTAANLIPRAVSHHKWYKNHFENYPEKRKAVIPLLL